MEYIIILLILCGIVFIVNKSKKGKSNSNSTYNNPDDGYYGQDNFDADDDNDSDSDGGFDCDDD